jgi:structural maintenance of chromosome 4
MSSKLAADAVSPAVLREYERDSETSAQQLQQAMEEARAAESEADRLSRSGPEIDMALQKLNLDIENGKRRISEAEKRVRDLKLVFITDVITQLIHLSQGAEQTQRW